MYLIGAILMVVNVIQTVRAGSFISDEEAEAPALEKNYVPSGKQHWHRVIERRPIQMLILSLVVVGIGGIIEIVPTFLIGSNVPTIKAVKPYTPLELHGRDIYIREGCYNCHSQMIRPFRDEVMRYDPDDLEYSKAGEFVYDHPFQWGSKRNGPDLHRVGGRYLDSWHYQHMYDPATIEPHTIMPAYTHLYEDRYDTTITADMINAMRTLGVPYQEGYETIANDDIMIQANKIVGNLKNEADYDCPPDMEIVALIAYLQRLGTDIKKVEITEDQ